MKTEKSSDEATKSQRQAQALADEIRVAQAVQLHASAPVLVVGNCMGLMNVLLVGYEVALSSGAIYLVGVQLIMLIPVARSYFRLRNKPRPSRVSKRRIRVLEINSMVQGLIWSGIIVLMMSGEDTTAATLLLFISYVMVYGGAMILSTMPRAALGFSGPIAIASIGAAIYFQILLSWILIVFAVFGSLTVLWAVWDNWRRLANEVRLFVENVEAEAERSRTMEKISAQLGKYMSTQLFNSIFSGTQKVEIASKRKKLTVFFSDIVNFTEITDQLESEELTALLNRYLTEMSKIALDHGGTIDKFIGDAIVVYFGDPDSQGVKKDADQCLRMAIAMQARVRELKHEWQDMGLERTFELRIGINTGYCTVGNFGSEDRMDYTIVGSEVNLAARLESASDVGGILLANETNSLVKNWVQTVENESISVKGFQRPVRNFRVDGAMSDADIAAEVITKTSDGFSLKIDMGKMSPQSSENAENALSDALKQLQGKARD